MLWRCGERSLSWVPTDTHDVDALFPNDPHVTGILKSLVDQVGRELNLAYGERDKWFNDGVRFFDLKTKSENIVFRHTNLVLKAADWHEMIAHKLTAFRGERDITDSVHFLKEIKEEDKEKVFQEVSQYRPFSPPVDDKLFRRRFDQVWDSVHGQS